MRVYLTEKVIFTEATRVDKSLCLPKLKSIAVLLYDFSTMNKKFLYSFTFVVIKSIYFKQYLFHRNYSIESSIQHIERS